MADSVTLYRMVACSHGKISSHMAPDENSYLATSRCEGGYPEKVGEFVSRPWCKTHKSDEFAPEEDTMLVCLQSVYDYEVGSDDGLPCEFVERLVKVIPDDH